MKHKLLSIVMLCALCCPAAIAENTDPEELLRLGVDVRVDYQYAMPDGRRDDSNTGFNAKYLVLRADGQIVKGLTYSWRQRFNVMHTDQSFFDATDWVYLNYDLNRWHFQAGKEVVAIGGYEYDRAPINLYSCSVFWNNIPCYDLGVSVGYNITPGDRLTFQAVQSPFFTKENRNLYAYNLMWNAHHGCYDAIWSANMIEYQKGRYINYLALGNKFTYRNLWLELDFMNRAASHQVFFFRDCSVMAELSWSPTARWRVFGKVTYDVNHSGTDSDYTVMDGTELTMAGAGVEFYPLLTKKHALRIHADAFYSWGHNANSANVMQHNTLFASVGLTWNMNLLSLKKKHKVE